MPSRALTLFPLCLLLGGLAACGFEPVGAWPLTLACFAGLIGLIERAATLRRALAIGWWFGLGHFCVGLNWIATAFTYQAAMPAWLGWIAVVLLSLYLAVYPAIATGGAWLIGRRGTRLSLLLALGGCWIVGEYLRARLFTGFAWNPLGVIWVHGGLLPLVARGIGTYGLSGLTVLIAGLPWLWWRAARDRRRWGGVASLLIGLALLSWPLPPAGPVDPAAPLLHVVQPNIGQDQKWSPEAGANNFARLASLSGIPGPRPRIVFWPEVAVPSLLQEDPLARARLAALLGPHDLMLTGAEAFQYRADGQILSATNSLFALDAQGQLLGRYDKSHLVPYGEYLPMRPLLSRIGLSRLAPGDMDFLPGPGPRDVVLPGVGKVGVQICYEIIFSGQVVDRASRPRFLFNPSNDAWFGRWGPPQHLAQARLRAIEEAMPIVRSTPTGISAIVDKDGRVLGRLPWRTPGFIEQPLPHVGTPTPFARFGNILPLALALLLNLIAFASRRWAR